MTDSSAENETRLVGLLAEFADPAALAGAAARMREAGYRRMDAFTPFPVHGLDKALAIRPTRLPWLVLAAGVIGAAAALGGQWWTNAVDFPFRVSGKPFFSLPANIPVIFEVTILLSAFAAFFGMLMLNGLPKLANPLFRSRRFLRATTDGFFLLVHASDGEFSAETTRSALEDLGAVQIEEHGEAIAAARPPALLFMVLALAAAAAIIPPLWIARARGTRSTQPRWHTFIDMDYQPKFKPQTTTTLFADGRAARSPRPGTVARGELEADDRWNRGIEPETGVGAPSEEAEEGVEPNWVTIPPLPATERSMRRGRERFNIYCAACHGRAGDGDGLVALRAFELEQGTWVPPTSLHSDPVREQPAGQLFHTITHGVRKMPGYGAQIPVEDRWAIVLYVRALQRSTNATLEDIPAEEAARLR